MQDGPECGPPNRRTGMNRDSTSAGHLGRCASPLVLVSSPRRP
jgi:hypothetical protein